MPHESAAVLARSVYTIQPCTMSLHETRAQELCESRGGRPGLPVPNSPYGLCGRTATLLLLIAFI